MIYISKSKLKAHMLQIFREIEETGEAVIVTDRNRPVLHIQPIVESNWSGNTEIPPIARSWQLLSCTPARS